MVLETNQRVSHRAKLGGCHPCPHPFFSSDPCSLTSGFTLPFKILTDQRSTPLEQGHLLILTHLTVFVSPQGCVALDCSFGTNSSPSVHSPAFLLPLCLCSPSVIILVFSPTTECLSSPSCPALVILINPRAVLKGEGVKPTCGDRSSQGSMCVTDRQLSVHHRAVKGVQGEGEMVDAGTE